MLVNPVDTRLKEIIQEVSGELCCEVLELEVMADPVHVLCEVAPLAEKTLGAARQVYNACLGELLCQSRAYQYARSLPRQANRRAKAVGFREYDLHHDPSFQGLSSTRFGGRQERYQWYPLAG